MIVLRMNRKGSSISFQSDPQLTLIWSVMEAALQAVTPSSLLEKALHREDDKLLIGKEIIDLSTSPHIWVVAIGKAGPPLALSLLQIIKDHVKGGICLYLPPRPPDIHPLELWPAAHPLPDQTSLKATQEVLRVVRNLNEDDVLLMLISGGGSAQLTLPLPGITLEEKRWVTQELMKAGANIQELNVVRKHLSAVKGGRLAQEASPARVINLVVSDVIGNDLEVIASGPTWYDSSTFGDAYQVLTKYHLWAKSPPAIRTIIKQGLDGILPETPKADDPIFTKVTSVIIGDNATALQAAAERAGNLGWEGLIITSRDQGEARKMARLYVHLLAAIYRQRKSRRKPWLLISGGELTVRVRGKGKGGRNQEFVLAALLEMKKVGLTEGDWLIMSLGTDGIDGPTEAAGAWIDGRTWRKVQMMSLHPERFLEENDSYHFFRQLNQLIITGPTGTNVMDLRLFWLA